MIYVDVDSYWPFQLDNENNINICQPLNVQ